MHAAYGCQASLAALENLKIKDSKLFINKGQVEISLKSTFDESSKFLSLSVSAYYNFMHTVNNTTKKLNTCQDCF